MTPPPKRKPWIQLEVRVHDNYWSTYYKASFGTSKADLKLLEEMIKVLDGKPAAQLSVLKDQID